MPNTPVWGQNGVPHVYDDQDLISAEESGSVIRVNDVNQDEDAKIALHAINTSTNAAARALRVDGKAEVVRNRYNETALEVANSTNGEDARAVKVYGMTEITAVEEDEEKTVGLQITNISQYSTSRALVVAEGESEFNDQVVINDLNVNSAALETNNTNVGANSRALKATGMAEIVANDDVNNDTIGLKVANPSLRTGSRSLFVDGKAEVDGQLIVSDSVQGNSDDLNLGTSNLTDDVVLSRNGRSVRVNGLLKLGGGEGGAGAVDATGEFVPLWMGTSSISTGDVVISHEGQRTRIMSRLLVGEHPLEVEGFGRIDTDGDPVSPRELRIGTEAETSSMKIGRIGQTCTINSALEIGADEDDPGLIDAALDGVAARDLNIGTQASTADVTLGRNGQDVNVNGRIVAAGAAVFNNDVNFDQGEVTCNVELHVNDTLFAEGNLHVENDIRGVGGLMLDGNADVEGALTVGPEDGAGNIDAGGVPLTPQNLKIGTGTGTANVIMSRAGQFVDMFGIGRLNNIGLVVNDADAVDEVGVGCGIIFNNGGHGNGSSIDFYTQGDLQGWLDSTGFHNA